LAHPHRQGVKSSDEKPTQDKDAAKTKLSQSTEFRQIIEEYANDLREIIKNISISLEVRVVHLEQRTRRAAAGGNTSGECRRS
jgi:hypothetical protein